jgi:hypothetical protein
VLRGARPPRSADKPHRAHHRTGEVGTDRADHRRGLKAVFTKVGVGSRGEFVAKLFAEHYQPALHLPDDPSVVHATF